jgi:hypothetical protein
MRARLPMMSLIKPTTKPPAGAAATMAPLFPAAAAGPMGANRHNMTSNATIVARPPGGRYEKMCAGNMRASTRCETDDIVRAGERGWAYPAVQKGVRHLLCEAPFGPFRQKVPDPFLNPRQASIGQINAACWNHCPRHPQNPRATHPGSSCSAYQWRCRKARPCSPASGRRECPR